MMIWMYRPATAPVGTMLVPVGYDALFAIDCKRKRFRRKVAATWLFAHLQFPKARLRLARMQAAFPFTSRSLGQIPLGDLCARGRRVLFI
jgi:hypothetical protein